VALLEPLPLPAPLAAEFEAPLVVAPVPLPVVVEPLFAPPVPLLPSGDITGLLAVRDVDPAFPPFELVARVPQPPNISRPKTAGTITNRFMMQSFSLENPE
jgi:hypothetical protein